ncbi:MAG: hypothetical protein K0S89_728, partial [Nitrososphaeraceae archaeon]|nr:hypothetical protein [Nitrososphaeraceae archaeon]
EPLGELFFSDYVLDLYIYLGTLKLVLVSPIYTVSPGVSIQD